MTKSIQSLTAPNQNLGEGSPFTPHVELHCTAPHRRLATLTPRQWRLKRALAHQAALHNHLWTIW